MIAILMRILDKVPFLLLSVVLVNVFVVLACPNFVVPPPLATQRAKVLMNLIICSIPSFWSVFLIICRRNRFCLAIGLINLVPAVGWLLYAVPLAAKAFYPS